MAVRDDDGGFRTTPPPRANPLLSFARDHLALLISIVGALIFVFRCIIVSSGDMYVAFILIAETSVGDAIRALLFTLLPFLLYVSSYVAAVAVGKRILDRNPRGLETLGMAAVSVALPIGATYLLGTFQAAGVLYVFVFSTFPLLFTVLLMLGVATERQRRGKLGIFPSTVIVVFVILVFGLALVPLVGVFADRIFWLPRESLDFKNEDPFTGYVLKVSEDHLVILNDRPRVIVEKHKDTLEDRDFCYPEDHKARSSNVKSDAPVCP
jgi:hypothetical protein